MKLKGGEKMPTQSSSVYAGSMLTDAINQNSVTPINLSGKVGYSVTLIYKQRHDQARIQIESVPAFLAALPNQNQFFAIELAHRFVGVTTPVIDGDRIMKEPLAMAVKTMPELSQALAAIQDSLDELTIPKEDLKPNDFDDPKKLIAECFDAVLYLLNLIAYVCRGFDLSMQDQLKQRMKKWFKDGVVKHRKE
ncbi:hypothetical protein LA430_11345 [Lactiplantibacillus plantarum]|uniref:hypothetical protein n=1 Tax=Lactiplantibacillus plantarum TaxID=1590 RepID=UPI001E589821|nr:hypothetical protein [Lactiplantibacillus plantarum]MCC6117104.1 hypothetical protein [Lactiplantibacillus plantarum]MCW6114652.1 hypothetical protein [Lactiplantibacillus plantarum]